MSIADRFWSWWQRRMASDYIYDDDDVVRMIRSAAQTAYAAGWLAAKRDK